MKDNVFSLVYSDYDIEEHYFFSGPTGVTQEDFAKLCDSLIPKAGYRAVLRKRSPKEMDDWVCWRDVVEALVSLLEEQGYQRVSLEAYRLNARGTIIGLNEKHLDPDQLGFSCDLIANHNRKIEKKMAEERKTRRKLSGLLKKRAVQIIK